MMQKENIYYSSVDLLTLSYDRAVMYLLIGDSVFLDLTVGYEDWHVRDFIWCMPKQNIYLASSNEGTLTCGDIGKVAAAVWRSWRSIHLTFLAEDWLIDEFLTTLIVGSTCGLMWSKVLNWVNDVLVYSSNIMRCYIMDECDGAKIW